jgi:hypothetical protein
MKSLVHSPFSYGFPMGFRFVSTGIVSGVRSPNMNVSEDGILSEAMPIGALELPYVQQGGQSVFNCDIYIYIFIIYML